MADIRQRMATLEAQALSRQGVNSGGLAQAIPMPPQELFDLDPKAGSDCIRAVVAEARRLQAEGLNLTQIAARWNAAGVPTLPWQGRPWDLKNIDNLLRWHGQEDTPDGNSTANLEQPRKR